MVTKVITMMMMMKKRRRRRRQCNVEDDDDFTLIRLTNQFGNFAESVREIGGKRRVVEAPVI